ncbi:ester cyclase [Mesorhizobium comanense]|uniref:ester cyclase n=1 Tax=Mesorhizobium comanense TaxID=2502215 RepID=UPI0010F4B075|nr:ester cyclase [Mesorhizobium comanense]
MTQADLYRGYIDCLNNQDWQRLHRFVHDEVHYNGGRVGLSGYREMLERDFREIPDLYFDVQLLISDPPFIASRIQFHCTPRGTFFDLPINGRKVSLSENVFYEYLDDRIRNVWSVIDKAAIEAQL